MGRLIERILGMQRITDPVFGSLLFQRVGFWEGSVLFEPEGRQIEVIIDGGIAGPTAEQHRLYAELSARYSELRPRVLKRITETAPGAGVDEPISEFVNRLVLVAIELPLADAEAGRCELTFDDARDKTHCNVEMEHWAPTTVFIEPD